MDHHYYVYADLNGTTFRMPFSVYTKLDTQEANAIGKAIIASIPGALFEYVGQS